jgi:hypoxia up-regulated 1
MQTMKVSELGKGLNGDEAAALGAAFQAAAITTGFKVQPFIVKDYALFPIEVCCYAIENLHF